MMALQILPILQVIVILCAQSSYTYPVYGTKRYGRSSSVRRISSPYQPYQQMVRTQRYPVNYYDLYPYTQNYPDDYYYPQESYPLYYPARTSKYEVYQAVLPYYYGERPVSAPGYGYYGYGDNDPVVDLQEEMLQEAEREEREESQPIGQEMLYENEGSSSDDNLDDVNAAFLQNLIMSQMYKDAVDNQKDYYDSNPYTEYYQDDAKWEDSPIEPKQSYRQEDEDVRELKQLAKPNSNKQEVEDIHWFQNRKYRNQNNWDSKRAIIAPNAFKKEEFGDNQKVSIAFTNRKPTVKATVSTTSTTSAPTTSDPSKNHVSGQKEEVLARPATPVRNPFTAPVLDMMTKNGEDHKRTPSVYDTIKHMLDMEKNLENKYSDELKPHMRKRIISSEESLTHQLSVLKKAQ